MLSFKPDFSLSSFIFVKRLFCSSSLPAIRMVSSSYLRLLIFLPVILIPAYDSFSLPSHMMYSAYKLNKQDDSMQPWCILFPIWKSVCCSISGFNYCFLTCIQVSQEVGMVVWYSHLFKNFPQFAVVHIVKGFIIHSQRPRGRWFSGILLVFLWSSGCWQFDLWFLCLF